MKLRISYISVLLAAVFSVRFAMMSGEANRKIHELLVDGTTFDMEKADAAARGREIKYLQEIQTDLLTFSTQLAEANQRSARITVSFLALGAVCYVLEERRRKRLLRAADEAKVAPTDQK
jgi:hypothetical protein